MSRTVYDDEQKANALALYATLGAAEAARQTGIPSGTIKAWASRNGVATGCTEVTRAAVAMAAAKRTYIAEEFRASMVERLAAIAELAASKEIERLNSGKATLHEIVGARTRAIHDLQLLTGEATKRTETVATDQLDREIERLLDATR